MKTVKNTSGFKGWKITSSIAVSLVGQSFILPQSQAFASLFVGTQTLNFLTQSDAQKATFPNAVSFTEVNLNLTDALLKEVAKKTGISKMAKDKETKAWQAKDAHGVTLGYFFVDKVFGKHELITYSTGISVGGTVQHVEILDYKETYGWQIDKKEWRNQFVGKTSASKFVLDEDIKNISGATLSCKHVTDGVKRMLAVYELAIKNKA